MLSSTLDVMLTLTKTPSPQKLFLSDYNILYRENQKPNLDLKG